MTEQEWYRSVDAGAMLAFLWHQEGISRHVIGLRFGGEMGNPPVDGGIEFSFERALHRFYLASCRRIWKLLPQEASRRGVELAEQYVAGTISGKELSKHNYEVEGAAFCIDYNVAPEDINRWVTEVNALPATELQTMLHPPEMARDIESLELLKRAAYFVDYSMVYPSITPKGPPPADYHIFLSTKLLRHYVDYPRLISDN